MRKSLKRSIRAILPLFAVQFTLGCASTSTVASSDSPINILFLGDTSHGESYHVKYKAEGKGNIIKEKGYDYSFANFKPILTDADYVIANVETPLTSLRNPPFPEKGYNHWTEPDEASAAYVRHGFDAVSLANNHTVDFGTEGLAETLRTLDGAGIAYFGAGMDKAKADKPLRKSFAVGDCTIDMTVFGRFEYRKSYDKKYDFYAGEGNAGASALKLEELLADIRAEKAQNPSSYVVIYPHWGKNYRWRLKKQERQARAMVEAGADLILGHGAHTLGEVMAIGDAVVVYSLGNFVFNTWGRFPANPEVLPMSYISQLSISHAGGDPDLRLKLYPIYSNNRVVNYQPRFVSQPEFEQVFSTIQEKGTGGAALTKSQNAHGFFIETKLKGARCR